MTGGAVLEETGSWAPTPDYGPVWYPPVDPGWVPYRYGHWANVAPWGWTWVDDASWGFAPFHYGRWVQIGPRWGWIPAAAGHSGAGLWAAGLRAAGLRACAGGLCRAGGGGRGGAGDWPFGGLDAAGSAGAVLYPPYRASENYVRNASTFTM